MAEEWSEKAASATLRQRVPERYVLRRLGATIDAALLDRPSRVGTRASATVRAALARPDPE